MLFAVQAYAQQKGNTVLKLKNELESFKYDKVISDADSILNSKPNINQEDLVNIYKMKGIAQFSLSDEEGAKVSFINILKIDSTFKLDSTDTSPKIISFFNQVKNEYSQILGSQKQFVKVDTVYVPKLINNNSSTDRFRQASIRSILIPGLGHLYLNQAVKGSVLTALCVLSIGSSIYFIIDSNKKESQYLSAVDPAVIQSSYKKYNTSYKLRNASLITFAAVWLYSQIDLLFFSGKWSKDDSSIQVHSDGKRLSLQLAF